MTLGRFVAHACMYEYMKLDQIVLTVATSPLPPSPPSPP
eukprot:COSAG06_NODE_70095_length_194_cov_14.747368_1_plen_38_part_10